MRQDPPDRVWAVRFRRPLTGEETRGWQLCANPTTMAVWRLTGVLAEEREYRAIPAPPMPGTDAGAIAARLREQLAVMAPDVRTDPESLCGPMLDEMAVQMARAYAGPPDAEAAAWADALDERDEEDPDDLARAFGS